MKRISLLLLALAVVALILVVLLPEFPEEVVVERSDGVRIQLRDAWVGTNQLPDIPRSTWEKLGALILPKAQEDAWLPTYQPLIYDSSQQRYMDQANLLRVWLQPTQDRRPADVDRSTIWIEGSDGWMLTSQGNAAAGRNSDRPMPFVGASFGWYPRWEKRLRVHVPGEVNDEIVDAVVEIDNPQFVAAPERWELTPDRTSSRGGAVFRLRSLTSSEAFPTPITNWWITPGWRATIDAEEAGLTNVWHLMRTVFLDNYGNQSVTGLLPLKPGAGNPLELRWKVRAWMCADNRSPSAGDVFWESPLLKVPDEGEAIVLTNRITIGDELTVTLAAFAGAGTNIFTNGVWGSSAPFAGPRPERESYSREGLGGSKANPKYRVSTMRFDPSIVMGATGDLEHFYLSCRVIDPSSGKTLWLRSSEEPGTAPYFIHQLMSSALEEFCGKTLKPGNEVKLIIGVHRAHPVDFVIEPPEFDRGAAAE